MKSFISLFLFITISLFGTNLNNTKNFYNENKLQLTPEENEYLKNKKVLKVHTQKSWEPYNFIEENQAKGVSNEILQIVAKMLNVDIEFIQNKNFLEQIEMSKNGELDIISNIIKTKKREEYFNFTNKTLFDIKLSILSEHNYQSLYQLRHRKVGIIKGYFIEDIIKKKFPTIHLVPLNSVDELISGLINKELEAILEDYSVINYKLKKLALTQTFFNNILLNDDFKKPLLMAINKQDTLLLSILNKTLNAIDTNTINQVFYKWGIRPHHNLGNQNVISSKEKELLETKNLNIYFTHWEPFSIHKTDSSEGMTLDIWRLLTSPYNINYEIKKTKHFAQALELIKADPNGVIIATSSTKDREEYGVFTKSITSFPIAIATNLDKQLITDLKELNGKAIAVGKDYTAYRLLKKHYPHIKFIQTKDTLEALNLLSSGKVYGAADISPALIYYMNQYGFNNLKIAALSSFNFELKFMFNKSNKEIIPIINKLIDSLDTTIKQNIINKWVFTKKIIQTDYTMILAISFISIIIISILLYLYFSKQKYQRKLEESEFRWKFAVEGSGDGLWDWDLQTNQIYFSEEWKKMLGYEVHEIENSMDAWEKLIKPEHKEQIFEDIQHHINGNTPSYKNEHQLLCKDGTYKWILDRGIVVQKDHNGNATRMIGTHSDIDERIKLEQEIKDEKNFISAMIDNANAIIAVINSEGRMVKVNHYTTDFLKYTQEEISSEPFFWKRFLPLEMKDKAFKIVEKAKQGKIVKSFKNCWIAKDGESRIFEWSNTLVKHEDGSMNYLATIGIDITDREKVQELILKQKEEFQAIFNYAQDGIIISDLDANILDCNKAFQDLTQFTKKELLKENLYNLTKKDIHYEEKRKELLLNGYLENYEKILTIKGNQEVYINVSLSLLPDKKRVLTIVKDMTQIKQAEEQIKLASMGELIGNIAHQWRQPLSVISTSASGLKFKSDFGETITQKQISDFSDLIMQQAEYLSHTIDSFRDFLKGDKNHKNEKVAKVLSETLNLIDASLKNNYITVIQNIDDTLYIDGSINELCEAFINIINNSKDALKEKIPNQEERFLFISTKELDSKVIIEFKDTAGGIPDEIIHRIFEPYFTTKHQSVGTGLGLSMVERIIRERHNGSIEAFNLEFEYQNRSYKGSCFKVVLQKSRP